jgi:beta-glucosidase
LPPGQAALIQTVSRNSKRCVVVVEGGSAVIMDPWKEMVQAILMAWYPGMEGGNALAAILFGEENPSGKLPVTFPAGPDQLPPFDNRAKEVEYGYYHGYRLFDREGMEPAFPFGFGLSYTTYRYANLVLTPREIGGSGTLRVSLEVTNVGAVAGREIIQVYVEYPHSGVDRPPKELKGFRSVHLEAGETASVDIEIEAGDLAYYDTASARWVIEEGEYTLCAGSSSREEDLTLRDTFRITAS